MLSLTLFIYFRFSSHRPPPDDHKNLILPNVAENQGHGLGHGAHGHSGSVGHDLHKHGASGYDLHQHTIVHASDAAHLVPNADHVHSAEHHHSGEHLYYDNAHHHDAHAVPTHSANPGHHHHHHHTAVLKNTGGDEDHHHHSKKPVHATGHHYSDGEFHFQ